MRAVFLAFLRLGCTSFGGPVAHLGYFRTEFVQRRRWLDEAVYADIVALCQFLPGPASSQVGIGIGMIRAGLPGGIAAWLGFTLPSALLMAGFAYGVADAGALGHAGWLHGLRIVAVAVVAQAVLAMAHSLCPDPPRASFAAVATVLALTFPSALAQIAIIAAGGALGWKLLPAPDAPGQGGGIALPRWLGIAALLCFFVLLVLLPLLDGARVSLPLALLDRFYRTGALVFGGGHVVLPLLQQAVVPPGWINTDTFMAGYGAAQAVPGPLFSFAAYLGTAIGSWPTGLLCLVAIYLPSFLLLIGVLPFWDSLRRRAAVRAALRGVNATVVGLLLAALYTPVWTSAINTPRDFAALVVAALLLMQWRWPPWLVVVLAAVCGAMGAV